MNRSNSRPRATRSSVLDRSVMPQPFEASGPPCRGGRPRTASGGSPPDPVRRTGTQRRAEEHSDRGRACDVRVDLSAQQIDHRARRRRDSDHEVTRRGGHAQRHTHREVHQRDLDDPAADAQQGRRHAGSSTRRCRSRGCGPGSRAGDAGKECGAGFDQARRDGRGGGDRIGVGIDRRHLLLIVPIRVARSPSADHRDGDIPEEKREEAGQDALVDEEGDRPPTSAPIAVNSSRLIPSRRFARCFSR